MRKFDDFYGWKNLLNETSFQMNKEKININGHTWYVDRFKRMIYEKPDSENGISIDSNHLTATEKEQIQKYLRFGY